MASLNDSTNPLTNSGDSACNFDKACTKKTPEGDVLSPWVTVTFNKAGRSISVGNESYPPFNNACIKDFEFGHENGLECRITIHDEQGGGFSRFMEDLIKDLRCANGDNQNMDVQFGWTASSCNSNGGASETSPVYKMMARDITCNFAGGKFMYEITGVDITEMVFESRITKTYSGDGDTAIHLVNAIDMMMKDVEWPPAIKTVKWLTVPGSTACTPNNTGLVVQEGIATTTVPITFKHTDGANIDPNLGPLGKWECKNENKLQVALRWLEPYVTINDKAIVPYYNSEEEAEVIFWEDNQPNCNEIARDWDTLKHGLYLVNGGNDSNVIEFNPRIKWNWSNLTNPGGNLGDSVVFPNEERGKQPGLPECKTVNSTALPSAGSSTTGAADENAKATYGDKAEQKTMEGGARQQKALKVFHYPIEADLIVVGEPTALRPSVGIFKNIHIVFLNPQFIMSGNGLIYGDDNFFDYGDWLAYPDVCNPILSNKAWLIRNITHRITEGKFTTTFGVYLATPGVDIDVGEPWGGAGSGGWIPPKNCDLHGVLYGDDNYVN